ncbi:class I SAM-dependent methyltransferase [Mycolicibacterium hodleri]|nr:class I SAM-dependent methyltransferase [Mycolicibacterium hodleri]
MRAALQIAVQQCGLSRDMQIYVTEQFGEGYRWLRAHFKEVEGSEYLSPSRKPGSRRLGIVHQDVQALSYAPQSFDYILSFDVLEHVPNHIAALESFARVLKTGGKLLLTVPFTLEKYDTTVRAQMQADGHIDYILPIEVHGNPTDPVNGALCYRHFGWDTLDRLVECGFADATVMIYHDRRLGYLGSLQSLITATKA